MTLGFTEIFIGFFIALLATLLPAVGFHIAFADIKEAGSAMLSSGSQHVSAATNAARSYIASKPQIVSDAPSATARTENTYYVAMKDEEAQRVKNAIRNALAPRAAAA